MSRPILHHLPWVLLGIAFVSCGRLGYELVARPGEVTDAGAALTDASLDDTRSIDMRNTVDDAVVANVPDTAPTDPCSPPKEIPLLATNAGCPAQYALVPGKSSTGIGQVDRDFCVPKFEMKAVNSKGEVVLEGRADGKPEQLSLTEHHPESRPDGRPWRFISQKQAKAQCAALGAGYHLMTNDEWMTIALQLEAASWTWSGCARGMGNLPTGFGGVAVSNTSNPYSDTGATEATPWGQGGEKRRALTLINGEVIWDFNNFAEWLEVKKDSNSVLLSVQAGDGTDSSEALVYQFDSAEFVQVLARSKTDTQMPPRFIALDPKFILPAASTWNGTRWIGANRDRGFGEFTAKKEYRDSKALMRGWNAMFDFSVYEYDGFDTWDAVGFRCVRDLP
ncbi:MAG: hypothetical protein SF187_25355 [Deltaproteobacteria bacterium]|nr:hypothetical protein [Deltaproteobacteria bacterium]